MVTAARKFHSRMKRQERFIQPRSAYNKSTPTDRTLCPSSRADNDPHAADWCATGAPLPVVVIYGASALPNSGRRYLTAPAELPLIDVAVGRMSVWKLSVCRLFFSRLGRSCPASRRAHFPFHSAWRPSSDGALRKTGRNKSEGGKRQEEAGKGRQRNWKKKGPKK